MDIKIFGDKILRQKCVPVSRQEILELQDFFEDMLKIMKENQGVGLAAPQVGKNKNVIAVDSGDKELEVLINPKITKKSKEKFILEEGCLSLPGVFVNVKRPAEVEIEFLDRSGTPKKIIAKGAFSNILQHELDHLDGRLIIDRLSLFKRWQIKKSFRERRQKLSTKKQP